MRNLLAVTLLLIAPVVAFAQNKLGLPSEIHGSPGRFIAVTADTPATSVLWIAADEQLDVFPLALQDPKSTVVVCPTPGKYKLWCVAAIGGAQAKSYTWICIDGPVPPPVPPGPVPPGPGPIPPVPPVPPEPPSPISEPGFRVLVVWDSSAQTKMKPDQLDALFADTVKDYMNTHCVKGPDGTPERRLWDTNADPSLDPSVPLKKAFARPRKSLPWIVVGNGKAGWEGALPATVPEMMTLLKRYGD